MTEKKTPQDMTPDEHTKLKVVFAPGCFDSFEGTQEELDELIAEIQKSIEDGTLLENSTPVDLDSLTDDDIELLEMSNLSTQRLLQ
jgi:hypothetical protein